MAERDAKETPEIKKTIFRLSDNELTHSLSFLDISDLLNVSKINRNWNRLIKKPFWQIIKTLHLSFRESKEDEKFLNFMQLICDQNKKMAHEIFEFVRVLYETIGPRFFSFTASADQYQVFEWIIQGKVEEFLQFCTQNPEFNFNYSIGMISPLFLSEVFPHPQIQEKLAACKAELFPHSPTTDREHFLKYSLKLVKDGFSPFIAELISRTLQRTQPFEEKSILHFVFILIEMGVCHDLHVSEVIRNLIKADVDLSSLPGPVLLPLFDDERIMKIGYHGVEVIRVILSAGLDKKYFQLDAKDEDIQTGILTLARAAFSVHALKPFFEVHPEFCAKQINHSIWDEEDELEEVSLLHIASPCCIPFLLEKKADPKPLNPGTGNTFLHELFERCAHLRDEFVVENFMSNEQHYQQSLNILKQVVKQFPEFLHKKNIYGQTPMLYAAECRSDIVLQTFINQFDYLLADRDKNQNTALHLALSSSSIRYWPTVSVLLQSKHLDINAVNNDGFTALHLALKHLSYSTKKDDRQLFHILKTVETLLKNPTCRLDIPDKNGDTALMLIDKLEFYRERFMLTSTLEQKPSECQLLRI